MISFENAETFGWEAAVRGMRNPMNSWDRSDSKKITYTLEQEVISSGITSLNYVPCEPYVSIGPNDHNLMMRLAKLGPVHGKFRRMITVYLDITAPLYW